MFGCGAECPVELWRQITRMGYLFTPKDKKLFSLTALLHFVPQRVAVGASAPTTAEGTEIKTKQNTKSCGRQNKNVVHRMQRCKETLFSVPPS